MKRHLIVFLLLGLTLTAIGMPFSGLAKNISDGYWFVWPYIALSLTTAVAAAVGLKWPARGRKALLASMLSCILIPVSSLFAIELWPGGDDGPGLGWWFIVMPASAVAGFWASLVLIAGSHERDR